jgi:hypothetical protein
MTLLPKPASPRWPEVFLRRRGEGLGVRRGDRTESVSSEIRFTSLSPVGTSKYPPDDMTACALVKGDGILKREVCVLVDAQAAEPQFAREYTPF